MRTLCWASDYSRWYCLGYLFTITYPGSRPNLVGLSSSALGFSSGSDPGASQQLALAEIFSAEGVFVVV